MKKAFLLAGILFISVISTACINNFAVQELNNKAKMFMDKGDYASAIERLKSSVDLDGTVFETRYNLAVAYTKAEDYANAIDAYNEAIRLNSNFADAYYSRAVCEENLAKDIISGEIIINENDEMIKKDDSDDKVSFSKKSVDVIKNLLNESIADYKIYTDKSGDNTDEKREELKALLEKYSQ